MYELLDLILDPLTPVTFIIKNHIYSSRVPVIQKLVIKECLYPAL